MGAIAGLNRDAAELQQRIERFQAVRDGILAQMLAAQDARASAPDRQAR